MILITAFLAMIFDLIVTCGLMIGLLNSGVVREGPGGNTFWSVVTVVALFLGICRIGTCVTQIMIRFVGWCTEPPDELRVTPAE
jgi:hypothetical protein